MFKSYLFLEGEPGADPFRYEGARALEACREALPFISGYTQTRTLPTQLEGRRAPPFTGIAELWLAQEQTALDGVTQANAVADLLREGTRVGPITVGWARTVMRLPEHHTGRFIKGVFPFRRKTGMSVKEFQARWWLRHGPIAAQTEHAAFYLQCHPLPASYAAGTPPFDGVTELHWRSVESAAAAMRSRQMTQDQAEDAASFVDTGSVVLFLAEEEVVVPA